MADFSHPETCSKDIIPWWAPFTVTCFILCGAISMKVFRAVRLFLHRHESYFEPKQTKQSFQRSQVIPDVERGRILRMYCKDSGDNSEDQCTEVESSDDISECENIYGKKQSVTASHRFTVHALQEGPAEPDSPEIHPSSRFHRLSSVKYGKVWPPWGSTLKLKTKKPFDSGTEEKDSSTDDLGRWGQLKQRLRLYFRGPSARQKLNLKLYCERYTTVSYRAGIVMFTVHNVLCTFSWIFYIIETVDQPPFSAQGVCFSLKSRILAWLNFIINLYCLGYYILRYCAATDRLNFVLSYTSLIELVAIPPSLLAAFQSHRHYDLNFVRATCLFNYVDVMTYLGAIKSNQSIQSARICFALFTMWMVGSGLMHGIDHLGDFWEDKPHEGSWSYFESCYFLLVTLSTVGYGDYAANTTLGRLFICIFIPVAMGVSASFIPELFRNFNTNASDLTAKYESIHGERHVLVCGNFDNRSLQTFINGFLSGGGTKGRERMNIVILRPLPIDFALKAILSHFHAWVRYFVGTPNNPQDLQRTKMRDARAAIVLATPNAKHRDAEDGANIMQAIALKARKKTLRVVVQLHNFKNKCLLNNYPRWTYLVNDMVVCMEELKLGLLAYNCLAPGFATLILNLLNIHGNRKPISQKLERWREEYEYGFRMEMHDVGISHEFNNIRVQELISFAYEKWNIIVVAVRRSDPPEMVLVPSKVSCSIDFNTMRAIVIAKNYPEALQLQNYCTSCFAHELGRQCDCRKRKNERRHKVTIERDLALYEQIGESRKAEMSWEKYGFINSELNLRDLPPAYRHSISTSAPMPSKTKTVLYNMLNGGPPTDRTALRRALTIRSQTPQKLVQRHGSRRNKGTKEQRSNMVDRTGSFHWVHDVSIAKAKLTTKQAEGYNFSHHFLVCIVGTPATGALNLENLIMPFRFHWREVQDIVILGNSQLIGPYEWAKLKNLPRIFLVNGDPCSFTDLYAVQLCRCMACVILGDVQDDLDSQSDDLCLQDRKTLLCAMNIRSLLQREQQLVHFTTELRYEKNAHLFSSVDTHANDYKLPVWFSEPFARGFVFSNTLLYSCLSSLFYNDDVFHFLRVLISGQAADAIEASFAVGAGLQPDSSDGACRINGVNVALRNFDQPPFSYMAREQRRKPLTFGEVFIRCISCWQILCLGLYRMESRGFRYVLANPDPKTILYTQDMFYCFMKMDQKDTPGSWQFGQTHVPISRSSP
ncbi:calcium-activated potassium channel subunit alpha-1 [Clonorchis sinensis]|uniref:Calcium-activated potassium channel subunit alpha-1 n=1 Tax=Clonorchis sinensis TaxID=79923 RepID=G7YFG4_CLOSI|nr:calcium-activated potassium channel subunit alpha-1 [Clonorchis sinensis]